ncbi:MAG: hypothetical protein WCK07_14710 [Betaproteobacteria bacterium]
MVKLATARGSLDCSEFFRCKPGTMIDRIARAIRGEVCSHVQLAGCAPRVDDE